MESPYADSDTVARPPNNVDGGPTYVVGVGASAGGLEALERMFKNIPASTGMSFVIVQHLSPDFRSLMDELLARWTSLKIYRVEDGMRVEPNAIYLLPPRKDMILSDGRLLLTDKDPDQGLSLPIDHFLRSLAHDRGRTAIAVILSGTGSDGSRGIEDIKRAGGLVIAQTAQTAKFDGMPNAARETGLVDISLDPEEIGDALLRYAANADIEQLTPEFGAEAAHDDGLTAIFRQLRDRYGLDFSYYKLNTVVRRTERRLQLAHVESVQEYAALLAKDTEELDALYRDLLVGVTHFFRDVDAYRQLEMHVDNLLAQKAPGSEFRAWIAGCATGEEAYSIAILLQERIRACGRPIVLRVFATDVHRRSLVAASEGVFRGEALCDVPADRLAANFTPTDGGFVVNREVREAVVFAQHNIIKDAPFTRMDLISCRNLLIYLQPAAQKKAISLFHFGLRAGGLLFLGASETPGELESEFEVLDGHWKIYRKRRDIRLPLELRTPAVITGRTVRASGLPEILGNQSRVNDAFLLGTYDALLAEYMPPALLINEQHELLHVFGDAGRFLQHRPGRAGKDVLELLDSKLRLAITGAIQQVHNKRKPEVNFRGIAVRTASGEERLAVTVRPVVNQRTQATDWMVILRTMESPSAELSRPDEVETSSDFSNASADHLAALEAELRYTRENLQATIEELETSNEELQATNEELVAANEELQSTNEELQSVNEELYTVNAEHQRKIHELTVMTDDMDNLLASTQVHTIFLDRELRIRKFTPQVAEIFNFAPGDLGRPFESFSHRLRRDQLSDEVARVLETGSALETDVQSVSGRWFLLRILPYRTRSSLSGVLLTLIDIDALKRTQQELARREFELRTIADHVPALICYVDRELRYRYVNQQCSTMFGKPPEEIAGMTMQELLGSRAFASIQPYIERALSGESVEFESEVPAKQGDHYWSRVSLIPDDQHGCVQGFFVCQHDISALKESEQRFARAVSGTTDGIWDWNVRTGNVYYSPRFAELLGFGAATAELAKVDVDSRLHPDDCAAVHAAEQALLRDGTRFDVEYRIRCRDGNYRWFRGRADVQRDAAGHPAYVSGSLHDIEVYRALLDEKARQVAQRDRFLAMLSHELRNPLGAVVNGCRVLDRLPNMPPEARSVIAAMARQSRQMAALLEDLLDVSRISEGKFELQKELIDLRDVVNPAIESVQHQIDARRQRVEQLLPDRPVGVFGSALRLQQVVSNLLSNASKYSATGSTIRVQLDAADSRAELRVIDQGEGIPPELLQRVFEPFEQLGRRVDRTDGGIGIGLSVARSLVHMHGGSIEARSEGVGRGSEFIVRLPTVPYQPTPRVSAPAANSGSAPLSVAIVEDNSDARELLQILLQQQGMEVSVASTGASGLELIRRLRPEVALIDIGLPEIDGYSVARAVRSDPVLRSTFLIALTGYGSSADRAEAIDAGFNAHLTKPVDLAELEQLLHRIADRRGAP